MQKYKYVGCFFEPEILHTAVENLRLNPLKHTIPTPHVTFEFIPKSVDESLFGTEVLVTIIGYGANEDNEGVLVRLDSKNETLGRMIKKIPVPHITLSISEKGKAFNTRFLRFSPVEPFTITGYYNGYIEKRG